MGLGDDAMREIEATILGAPEAHPVPCSRACGVRKPRFARPGTGKSGGGRTIYYVALKAAQLWMLAAYAKNEKGDLTPADRRAILRMIEGLTSGDRE